MGTRPRPPALTARAPPDLPPAGFDPLKLAEKPANLARYREAELIHCRWAMLGAAGFIAVEALGYGDWITAAYWPVTGEPMTYFGQPVPFDVPAVTAIEAVAIAYVESARNNETDSIKRIYPGFDPLGLTKDAKAFETAKWQEIRNGARPRHRSAPPCERAELGVAAAGRLAMLAMIGFWGQAREHAHGGAARELRPVRGSRRAEGDAGFGRPRAGGVHRPAAAGQPRGAHRGPVRGERGGVEPDRAAVLNAARGLLLRRARAAVVAPGLS